MRYFTDILTERAVDFVAPRPRPALAAQPQLHDAALAVGGPRRPRRQRRAHRRGSRAARPGRCSTTTAAASTPTARWSRASTPRSGRCSTRCAAPGRRRTRWSCSPATTAASGSRYNWPLTRQQGRPATRAASGCRRSCAGRPASTAGRSATSRCTRSTGTRRSSRSPVPRPDPEYPLDGTSLAGYLLRGRPVPQRDLFWRMVGPAGAAPRRPQVRPDRGHRPPLRPRRGRTGAGRPGGQASGGPGLAALGVGGHRRGAAALLRLNADRARVGRHARPARALRFPA